MGVRDVLSIRDYRTLFAGQAVSDIGDGITLLLVLLVINELTGSTAALALMAIAEAVPAFTVGLVAGVYVDRWDRRRIMLARGPAARRHRPALRLRPDPGSAAAALRPRLRAGTGRDLLPPGARRAAAAHRAGGGPAGGELAGPGLPWSSAA